MKKKPMEFKILGIKCDAPGCGFRDDTVEAAHFEQWLNKPCPKCGANLLTQADYDLVKLILKVEKFCNRPFIGIIGRILLFGRGRRFKGDMNGSGKIKFTELKLGGDSDVPLQ